MNTIPPNVLWLLLAVPTKPGFKTGSGGSGGGGGGGGIRCGSGGGGGKLPHQLTSGNSANDDEGYEESLYFQPTRTLRKDQQQMIYHNSGSK